MILQSIAWPDRPEDRELYYRSEGSVEIDAGNRALRVGGRPVRFDTYFNAFSHGKWMKYTRLGGVALTLELKGEAEIALLRHDLRGESVAHPDSLGQSDSEAVTRAVRQERFSCPDFQTVTLEYPDCGDALGLSFEVRPLSETATLRRAAYCSAQSAPEPDEVNLALAICTYKREEYVAATMETLRRDIFDDPLSRLNGHVRVYIADNARTLDAGRFAGMPVRVFPNINSGGSGGFSRAAIEAVHDGDFRATHIILMDDDISFNVWALERNLTFLSLIRQEYAEALIGGSMLNADCRHWMYSAGDILSLEHVENWHRDWELNDLRTLLALMEDVRCDCFAWWYCCVPTAVFRQRQYSMPFFMQFDDVEFSMRCRDLPKIVLNGICCWHAPLEQRETDSRCYYCFRNFSVMYSLYFPEYTAKYMKKKVADDVLLYLFTFSYRKAHMVMRGAEDFLRGVDWLIAQDPAALNRELLDDSDKLVPAESQPAPFNPADIRRNSDIDQNPLKRRLRWITLNGWLLPARRRTVVVQFNRPQMQFFFRAKNVVRYDESTHLTTAFRRSYREAFRILRRLRKTCKAIDREYDRAAADFKARRDEITSEAFWRRFLQF